MKPSCDPVLCCSGQQDESKHDNQRLMFKGQLVKLRLAQELERLEFVGIRYDLRFGR